MASSAKQFSLLVILTLLSSLHVNARSSQFFSKATTNINNNNAKEITVPIKEEPLTKQQQEPNFTAQNQNGAYGLYGQDSASTSTSNNYYYNNEAYVTGPQGMSDTRFTERGYTTPTNNYNYNKGGNIYNPQQQNMGRGYTNRYYNGGHKYTYTPQKEGMSDTRFLENGRYFYDLNSENYNVNENERIDSRYGYNNRGRRYGNNENSYEYNNSMEGYQNQEESQYEYSP